MNEKNLKKDYDYLAPDGSEIRLLVQTSSSGICHCTLPSGKKSKAVKHKTVLEIWYFIEGMGQVWRKNEFEEKIVDVKEGSSLTIEPNTHFQFINKGETDLKFIIFTLPSWPGAQEAIPVKDKL